MAPAARPKFSVIVPAYNRAGMICRALRSVLADPREDLEVIVVDDCSSDGTAAAVEAIGDGRVRLLRHPVNRGVCAARNTAIDAARGAWFVMLDSDFELLDGGLATLERRCDAAPADVGNVATICTWDRGPDTPQPLPTRDAMLRWPEYLAFIAGLTVSEWFNCYRREVFDGLRFPAGRAYEASFHLAAAARWRFWMCTDRVVLIHTDATNRITASPPAALARRLLRDAQDGAADADAVLHAHRADLAAHAPRLLAHFETMRVYQHFLAGHRLDGLDAWARASTPVRRSPRVASFVALGMLGPRAFARLHTGASDVLRRLREVRS